MTAVAWMIGASVAAWLAAAALSGGRSTLEILLGMVGPLAAVCGTWMLIERTFRRDPGRLTSVMAAAFAVKLVFFGGYVAFALRMLPLKPVPFVISFTGYFIGLYLTEALILRRLHS